MEFSSTKIPVDDVRLATGEVSERARIIVNLSTVKVVAVEINGGLVVERSSYHWVRWSRSRRCAGGERLN